jgi:type I restriction enzyme S subunit
MNEWKPYRLGEFLKRQYESVTIDDFTKYKRITIKTKGQGISLRDTVDGIEIGTKSQFKVKENQFLLSKIDAMNGAFGIVPNECDGGIITGNFWTYEINEEIIDREFLRLLCIKQVFTNFCIEASEGTTNRKYLREDIFLNLNLYLPPLSEQKRIVTKIESIKGKIEAIRKLREEQEREMKNLRYSIFEDLKKIHKKIKIKEFATIVNDNKEKVDLHKRYKLLGMSLNGEGLFFREEKFGSQISSSYLNKVIPKTFIYSRLFAWKGAFDLCDDRYTDCYVSDEYPMFYINENICSAKYLMHYFHLQSTWLEVEKYCTGLTKASRNRFKEHFFLNMSIPLPPIEEQNRIAALLDKANSILQIQKAQEKELNELLPSLLDKAFKGEL